MPLAVMLLVAPLLSVYNDSDSEGTNIGGARDGALFRLFFFCTVDDTILFLATVLTNGTPLASSDTPRLFLLPVDLPFRLFLAGVLLLCLPVVSSTGSFPRRGDLLIVVFLVDVVMYFRHHLQQQK